MARRPYGGACAWMLGLDMRNPRNTKAGIGAKVPWWSEAPGQGERGDRLGFLARWGVLRNPQRDKLNRHGSFLVAQVKGATGEGLSGGSAQRKWQSGRVYSPGCGDGIQPAGCGGFHPERGAPRPAMAGVLFFRRTQGWSQRGFLQSPELPPRPASLPLVREQSLSSLQLVTKPLLSFSSLP
jgi:hypothetical protein